jgi:3'-phosphoadenosine 5'-phosphosulfate sulfotransferase (PAPS reductase)/FAD synthetase
MPTDKLYMAHGNDNDFATPTSLEDLRRAHDIVVSSSGGVDSLVALLLTFETCREANVLDRLSVVHADMGEQEHEGSLEIVQAQCKAFDVPLTVVRRNVAPKCAAGTCDHPGPVDEGSLISQWAHKQTHSRVGSSTCQGTSDHKVGPIRRHYTALTAAHQATGSLERHRLIEVVGLAAHEGGARKCRLQGGGKKELEPKAIAELGGRYELATDVKLTNSKRATTTWWPIADLGKQGVWDAAARALVQYGADIDQDVYAVLPRYSCQVCPFASRDALNVTAQRNPALFAKVVEIEKTWTRAWDSSFTLADVLEDVKAGRTVDKATTWGDQA